MRTIVIPQFYRGPSGQKGLYNRQEVGLARAFAALGCRAVVLYPEPGAKAPKVETPEPNVKICYLPAVAFGTQALYKSWQILLDEQADAVHVMGDNSLGVPCRGLMPVGLDTAIIPTIPGSKAMIRRELNINEQVKVLAFVGRLDAYKQPLDLVPLLQAAPDWYAVIIGQGAQSDELTRRLTEAGLMGRCRLIPQLPNAQVHIYYHACNAFVNLNENEIFGMSLLEAMYAGCPPVARHAPGPDLIIENGISGYLCDTVAEMAAALDKTTDAMGHAAQNRVNEHFLWQNSAELALTLLPKKGKTNG